MPPDAPRDAAAVFRDTVTALARAIARLEPGPLAELRRFDPDDGAPPAAFWKLVHVCALENAWRDLRAWERVAHALAVLTPTGRDPAKRSCHDATAPFGLALARAKVSEARVMRLLAAEAPQRREILTRLCRRLARADARLDAPQLARLLIHDDAPDELRRLANDYYRAPTEPAPTDREPADV
jgi:hypothetical protein